jgi:mono/diheme cytochrome c family protein
MGRKGKFATVLGLAAAGVAVLDVTGLGVAGLAFSQGRITASSPAPQVSTPTQLLTQPIEATVPNADQVRRGQYLVRMGDCVSCHTRDGGEPLAGGYGLNTPFGVIYTQNLTSDPDTGIGNWSPDQFYQALHNGVGPHGMRLYPGLPYPYFTRATRADSDAILAYLKSVPAVSYRPPANGLPFPLNIRFFVRGWNMLFFRPGEFKPDSSKSAEWNRGAYIVTGLGHCEACHTPKNFLAGDKTDQPLHGGELDNWVAPDLTSNPRIGLGGWSADDIVEFLKTGRNAHANAAGSMAEVVSFSTSLMSDQDLHAIAVYLKDRPASPSPPAYDPDPGAMKRGAAVYSDACSSCHLNDGVGQPRFFPPLKGDAMAQQPNPDGLLHLILAGGRTAPTPTRPSPLSMASFAWKLDDQQVADVSTYIRNSWGNRGSAVSASQAAHMRSKLGLKTVHLTDNSGDHD